MTVDYLTCSVPRWKGNSELSDDDDDDGQGEGKGAQAKKKNKKQPPPQKKKAVPSAKKKKNVEPAKASTLEAKVPSGSVYKAGNFSKQRVEFINEARKGGHSYKAASAMWMNSDTRANLLADMPLREQIRRRFVPAG